MRVRSRRKNAKGGRPERCSRNQLFAIGRRSPPARAIRYTVIPRVAGLPVDGAARLDLLATSECDLAKTGGGTDKNRRRRNTTFLEPCRGEFGRNRAPRGKDLPPTRVCKARQAHQYRYGRCDPFTRNRMKSGDG